MEIELTEVQILRLEDGDVLMFRPRMVLGPEGSDNLIAAVRKLEETVSQRTGKRIVMTVIDTDIDFAVARHA